MSLGRLSQAANILSTQLRLEGALMRPAGVIYQITKAVYRTVRVIAVLF